MKTLLLLPLVLASCTMGAFEVIRPTGTSIAYTGGSLGTKYASRDSKVTRANGTILEDHIVGMDETTAINVAGNMTVTHGVASTLKTGVAKVK